MSDLCLGAKSSTVVGGNTLKAETFVKVIRTCSACAGLGRIVASEWLYTGNTTAPTDKDRITCPACKGIGCVGEWILGDSEDMSINSDASEN